MNEREGKKSLIDHVAPNRRDFVRRILAGTAFVPPLIATFSIDTLTANAADDQLDSNSCNVQDQGYVGPNYFQAHVSDPKKDTRANGVGTFLIVPAILPPASVSTAKIETTLVMTGNTTVDSAHIEVFGNNVCSVPPQGGTITAADVHGLCDFDGLLEALAAGIATLVCKVTVSSSPFTLKGPILPASPITIKLNP